jgi:uncharacterized protein
MSRSLLIILLTAALTTPGASEEPSVAAGRNRLVIEKSPYLRQHAGNPIWWWTWSPEALQEAKREGKPIFLSIGYSSCHWCHVMERESFTKADVAAALNASYVAIKVDREERPDLDEIYLRAVEALTGSAGWPLTVLLTPDGKPFFGATYLAHDKLLAVLTRAAADWAHDRSKAEALGAELSKRLVRDADEEPAGPLNPSLLLRFAAAHERGFDWKNGGPAGAPKFPPAAALRLLLRIHRRSGNQRALEMVTRTLDAMARGGIHDQLGGGFHRYATDERWLVPHFEKMLYDQAALVQAYVDGFQATGRRQYASVARAALDYVLRDLTTPEGGFCSAEDADSEGEEGRFYTWREAELRALLPPAEFEAVRVAFAITPAGQLPGGGNILHRATGEPTTVDPVLGASIEKIRRARAQRPRPSRDDKVLTDWNGLTIAAMARAGRALDERRYVEGAARAARFVLARLGSAEGGLLHRLSGGEAKYPANLDDYAFLIDGLIELYQCDFDPVWLERAQALQKTMDARFRGSRGGYWFTDGSDVSLLLREVRRQDNVVPAGNSVAALDLLRLSDLLVDPEARTRARAVLATAPRDVARYPEAFPVLLAALDYSSDRSKEVAIVGERDEPQTRALLSAVWRGFNPNLVVAVGPPDAPGVPLLRGKKRQGGAPTAYVCEEHVCRTPTSDPAVALELARTFKPLAP